MQANRRRDTAPEVALRRVLHRRGLRFRVDYRVGCGRGAPRPDIAFTRWKVAVFVDGCFWHSCPLHGATPTGNRGYWEPKLARNRQRDRENDLYLIALGWAVVRAWEHEDAEEAGARVAEALSLRGARVPGDDLATRTGGHPLNATG